MANGFSLSATIEPEVDERAAQREADQLGQTFSDGVGDLSPDFQDDRLGGVGALGGAKAQGAGAGGGGGVAGAGAAASVAGRGVASGVASGALTKVALGGAIGFGILQSVQTLAGASPALKQTTGILSQAMDLFFRPFGNALSNVIRPFATEALEMAKNFNDVYQSDGLLVALGSLGKDVATTLAGANANALKEILTGQGDASDFVTVGVTGIAAAKLAGLLPSIGLGSILTGISVPAFSSLIPSIGIGSTLSGLSTSALAGLLGTVGSVAALIAGTASLTDLVDGDISDWNLPAQFGSALGKAFEKKKPELADDIEDLFKNNIAFDFGRAIRRGVLGKEQQQPEDTETPGDPTAPESTTGRQRDTAELDDRTLPDVEPSERTEDMFTQPTRVELLKAGVGRFGGNTAKIDTRREREIARRVERRLRDRDGDVSQQQINQITEEVASDMAEQQRRTNELLERIDQSIRQQSFGTGELDQFGR